MPEAGDAVREALEDLMDTTAGPALPPLPDRPTSWWGVVHDFGGRPQVADYLGKKGAERKRFLASLSNWERGHDRKADRQMFKRLSKYTPQRRSATAERKRIRREQPPIRVRTMAQVLDAIERRGLTIVRFSGAVAVHYNSDIRDRTDEKSHYIPAGDLTTFVELARAGAWEEAANGTDVGDGTGLASLWGPEYGIDKNVWWDEVDTLQLRIGGT